MERVTRHFLIVIAAIVSFFLMLKFIGIPALFSGIEWNTAYSFAVVWLLFSVLFWKPNVGKWLILGFISPFVWLPIFYQVIAWHQGYGFYFPELGPALLAGLLTAVVCFAEGLLRLSVVFLKSSKLNRDFERDCFE